MYACVITKFLACDCQVYRVQSPDSSTPTSSHRSAVATLTWFKGNFDTSVQQVYQNAVCIRALHFIWFTAMHVLGILHLLHEVPRDLPVCVQRLCGHPYGNVSQQAVQIPTAVAPKCRLRQCSPLGVVYCHAHYRNCTPTVRGTPGSHNLCTKVTRASVRQRKSASCTTVVPKCRLRRCSPLGLVY